jgi:hypothetical protein
LYYLSTIYNCNGKNCNYIKFFAYLKV